MLEGSSTRERVGGGFSMYPHYVRRGRWFILGCNGHFSGWNAVIVASLGSRTTGITYLTTVYLLD